MEKENARKQTLEQLHERRKQVIRLHKKGIKIMQTVAMTGLSYPCVRAAIDLFEAGGWAAIRPACRGRSRGDARILSPVQEQAIQRIIIENRPEQLKMEFALWSRAAVMQLIERECGVPVIMSPMPLEAVVLGAGHCIEHYDALKYMFMGARR